MKTCLTPNGPSVYRTPSPAEELIAATADGVATLQRRSPTEWVVTHRALAGQQANAVLHEPRDGGFFAALHNGGLHASLDGGQTWQPRMQGIAHDDVFTLASVERGGQDNPVRRHRAGPPVPEHELRRELGGGHVTA